MNGDRVKARIVGMVAGVEADFQQDGDGRPRSSSRSISGSKSMKPAACGMDCRLSVRTPRSPNRAIVRDAADETHAIPAFSHLLGFHGHGRLSARGAAKC
jgi:hypothetical protein